MNDETQPQHTPEEYPLAEGEPFLAPFGGAPSPGALHDEAMRKFREEAEAKE